MCSMWFARTRSQSGVSSNHISELMTIRFVALSIRSHAASAWGMGCWVVLTSRASVVRA